MQAPILRFYIVVFEIFFIVTSTAAGKVIYVDDSATGANNGISWDDAYNFLQDALADADSAEKPIEIRVAQGIYKPDQGEDQTPGDREATFRLMSSVTLKGGYAGFGSPDPNARDIGKYETILSGDLNGDDERVDDPNDLLNEPSRSENSYHVVTGSRTDDRAVLDGFSITSGNNDHSCSNYRGGGIYIEAGTPIVNRCSVVNNAAVFGGGIYNISSTTTMHDCIIRNNFSGAFGGGVYNEYSDPVLINCRFIANLAAAGGGLFNFYARLRLSNCTFSGNMALSGAGLYNNAKDLTLDGCVFSRNLASMEGGGMRCQSGTVILNNCIFIGNSASHQYPYNLGQSAPAGNGAAIYCHAGNIAINHSTFTGNSIGENPVVFISELDNIVKITGCILWDGDLEIYNRSGAKIFIAYSNIRGGQIAVFDPCDSMVWGRGNIDNEPCFATPGYWDPNGTLDDTNDDFWVDGDYHPKSQAGRWDPETQSWVKDDVTSPCIDAGDPAGPIGNEPFSNGGRINMGAYGGTAEASKSYFGEPICEYIVAGDINGDCVVNFIDLHIMVSHWLSDNNPNIETDFQKALQMLPAWPIWPNGIMFYDMQDAADTFISVYNGISTVDFLQTKIEDPNSTKLALLCLAKLAPRDENAKKILYEQILGTNPTAVVTIAYLQTADARPMAEELLATSGQWNVRVAAANMLIGLGDQNSLELLEQISEIESHTRVIEALKSSIQGLRYRLTQVRPDLRDEWAWQELLCWRTLADKVGPPSITDYGDESSAAETLHMQGVELSREYLEYKLSMGDILVIDMIGYQKEAWAIPDLGSYATLKGGLGKSARAALVKIGTNEALRTLEGSLLPGAPDTVFAHVMSLLCQYGDQTSAEFAKRLSSDQRYSESERRSLEITYEIILKRLEQNCANKLL